MGGSSAFGGQWLRVLIVIDGLIAMLVRARRCPHCGGRLDAAPFRRSVWGSDDVEATEVLRQSFCCSREGCRRRVTTPSVLFWGRLRYAGALVLRVGCEPAGSAEATAVQKMVGCHPKTARRWRERVAGLLETPTGKVIAGWMPWPEGRPRTVARMVASWAGGWAHQAARWMLLIHPLTGGPSWERSPIDHRPLDTHETSMAARLEELKVVPCSLDDRP